MLPILGPILIDILYLSFLYSFSFGLLQLFLDLTAQLTIN